MQEGAVLYMGYLMDEPLGVKKEQYEMKNEVLIQYGEQVSQYTFYEDIFGDLDTVVPVIIQDQTSCKSMTIDGAIDFSAPRNDTYMSCCTYYNNWYCKKTAHDIYGFVIDCDSVWAGGLLNGLRNDWQAQGIDRLYAKPTYIVNSGNGIHLYFVLKEPIPCYFSQAKEIGELYRALALQQTAKAWIGQKAQVQWFGQSFRMVGSLTKDGFETIAIKYGPKWDIDDLAKLYGIDKHFLRRGEHEDKEISINARKKRTRVKRSGFYSNQAFYEYSLKTAKDKTKEGHRYMSMCALVVIGYKCNVPVEVIEQHLYNLLADYNKDTTNKIKEREIKSALKMYGLRAMETTRERLEDWLGWEYKPIRRNGRKRADHIRYMNGIRALKKQMGEEVNEGRPSAEKIVKKYLEQNPTARKCDVIKGTCLSKPTVYKYYDDIVRNIVQ